MRIVPPTTCQLTVRQVTQPLRWRLPTWSCVQLGLFDMYFYGGWMDQIWIFMDFSLAKLVLTAACNSHIPSLQLAVRKHHLINCIDSYLPKLYLYILYVCVYIIIYLIIYNKLFLSSSFQTWSKGTCAQKIGCQNHGFQFPLDLPWNQAINSEFLPLYPSCWY